MVKYLRNNENIKKNYKEEYTPLGNNITCVSILSQVLNFDYFKSNFKL